MTRNHAREGGGAVFFVSNDRTGTLEIRSSTLQEQPERRLRELARHLLPRPQQKIER